MLHFIYIFRQIQVLSILNMLHTLRFSLQNAVYFIMLSFLLSVLFIFYVQGVLKFKCKTPVKYSIFIVPSFWNTFEVAHNNTTNKTDEPTLCLLVVPVSVHFVAK
jgi:uncharacterized membrane protein YGL010W